MGPAALPHHRPAACRGQRYWFRLDIQRMDLTACHKGLCCRVLCDLPLCDQEETVLTDVLHMHLCREIIDIAVGDEPVGAFYEGLRGDVFAPHGSQIVLYALSDILTYRF